MRVVEQRFPRIPVVTAIPLRTVPCHYGKKLMSGVFGRMTADLIAVQGDHVVVPSGIEADPERTIKMHVADVRVLLLPATHG